MFVPQTYTSENCPCIPHVRTHGIVHKPKPNPSMINMAELAVTNDSVLVLVVTNIDMIVPGHRSAGLDREQSLCACVLACLRVLIRMIPFDKRDSDVGHVCVRVLASFAIEDLIFGELDTPVQLQLKRKNKEDMYTVIARR